MKEYINLGHMSRINNLSPLKTYYFLPHHGVQRESSLTTKLRVVFDASCPTDNGLSLNDIILIGATIQDELFSIFLRFRQHPIIIRADIEKMYRMMNVYERFRSFQGIYWCADPSENIEIY